MLLPLKLKKIETTTCKFKWLVILICMETITFTNQFMFIRHCYFPIFGHQIIESIIQDGTGDFILDITLIGVHFQFTDTIETFVVG